MLDVDGRSPRGRRCGADQGYSHPGLDRRQVDFGAIVRETVDEARSPARRKTSACRWKWPAAKPRSSAIPARLRQIVTNLLSNAVKGQSSNNRRARYYRLTREGRKALGDAASGFDRVIDAIARVMRRA
jgi:hypothetical protein